MIYNLVFYKGEEKESTLTRSPEAYYLDKIFPKDEDRIKAESGGKISDKISFYSLKYLYKLDENTIMNFFLYKDDRDTFRLYEIKSYNAEQFFLNTERHIDIFINDKIFDKEKGIPVDKDHGWNISKKDFVQCLLDTFSFVLPDVLYNEAIVALMIEVIMEGGYKTIDYLLGALTDNQSSNGFIYTPHSKQNDRYQEELEKIIKKYSEDSLIQLYLDPSRVESNNSNMEDLSNILIQYLEEIKVAKRLYEASKPIAL